jgi:CheY-like chemotaxis protein/HPt (histidine-containing phosphotransfer) domain-containing protein
MGGSIGVESAEGRGSTFWFTVLFEKQPEENAAAEERFAEIEGAKVLVVDDNETNRLLATTLLRSWGCRFDEAAGAETAIFKLQDAARKRDPFEVALLDMLMPEVDGVELSRRIKASPELDGIRLIMMTSVGQRGDASYFERLGFSGYLCKPIRHSQFRGCLALVLGRKAMQDVTPSDAIVTRHAVAEKIKQRNRILLAEDNITNQKVALSILKKLGYRVDAVANGLEAFRQLQTVPYDLVLMDCQMPEMDGYDASRRIREEGSGVLNPMIPIVAMTAHAMKGAREKCIEAGMNDYIAKPIQPVELEKIVDQWLHRMPRETASSHVAHVEMEINDAAADGRKLSDSAIFNEDVLRRRLMEDEEIVRVVIETFLNDIPGQLDALRSAVEAEDARQAELLAHRIKGAAGNVSAIALETVASEMEQAARAEDVGRLGTGLDNLHREFALLKQAIAEKKRVDHEDFDYRRRCRLPSDK